MLNMQDMIVCLCVAVCFTDSQVQVRIKVVFCVAKGRSSNLFLDEQLLPYIDIERMSGGKYRWMLLFKSRLSGCAL